MDFCRPLLHRYIYPVYEDRAAENICSFDFPGASQCCSYYRNLHTSFYQPLQRTWLRHTKFEINISFVVEPQIKLKIPTSSGHGSLNGFTGAGMVGAKQGGGQTMQHVAKG